MTPPPAYREVVRLLADWCQNNYVPLNHSKTKELVMDFRQQDAVRVPNYIRGDAAERVSSFKFLGVTLHSNLKGTVHMAATLKKGHQCIHFFMSLKKAWMSTTSLTSFNR